MQQKEGEQINQKLHEQFENSTDLKKINEARQLFKDKKFINCINKYQTVDKKYLLTNFDKKSIVFCEKHLS